MSHFKATYDDCLGTLQATNNMSMLCRQTGLSNCIKRDPKNGQKKLESWMGDPSFGEDSAAIREKPEKCEAEIEAARKMNELTLLGPC
ncbi:hypothetical protein QQ045_009741 [Rhodiola kirilowii]